MTRWLQAARRGAEQSQRLCSELSDTTSDGVLSVVSVLSLEDDLKNNYCLEYTFEGASDVGPEKYAIAPDKTDTTDKTLSGFVVDAGGATMSPASSASRVDPTAEAAARADVASSENLADLRQDDADRHRQDDADRHHQGGADRADDAQALLRFLREHGPASYGAAAMALGWPATRAWRAEAALMAAGLVRHLRPTGKAEALPEAGA